MYPTLPVSNLLDIVARVDALAAKEAPTIRDCWEGIELAQQYADALGDMAEDLPEYDGKIVIKIHGATIQFDDAEAMTNYLAKGVMHGK